MTMKVEQKVQIFHITGPAPLTLFLSPLIMILPLILFFFVQDSLRKKNNPQLHFVNYSICLLMTVIGAILLIIAVVVTFLLSFPVILFLPQQLQGESCSPSTHLLVRREARSLHLLTESGQGSGRELSQFSAYRLDVPCEP